VRQRLEAIAGTGDCRARGDTGPSRRDASDQEGVTRQYFDVAAANSDQSLNALEAGFERTLSLLGPAGVSRR